MVIIKRMDIQQHLPMQLTCQQLVSMIRLKIHLNWSGFKTLKFIYLELIDFYTISIGKAISTDHYNLMSEGYSSSSFRTTRSNKDNFYTAASDTDTDQGRFSTDNLHFTD